MNRRRFLMMAGLIALSATNGAASYTEDVTIRYVKTLPVSELDKHLSSQPLDKWLRSGPPHLDDVSWEVDEDCGIQPEDREPRGDKRPLCVKFVFRRSGPGDPVDGSGIIQIGTLNHGIIGPPQFRGFKVNVPFQGYMESGRLADLPSILDEASAVPKTEKEELDYARNLDVNQLDSTLPSIGLEDWLRSEPNAGRLMWRTSPTCELKEPEPVSPDESDWETCVKFIVLRRGASGPSASAVIGLIIVGTERKGITGTPRFDHFAIWVPPEHQPDESLVPDYDTKKLSDLSRALAELSSRQ